MENKSINQTPVRTSRSFNINNIKIDENVIQNDITPFNNVEIINDSSKIQISNSLKKDEFKYGIDKFFLDQANNKSNCNINIVSSNLTNKDVFLKYYFDDENKNLVDNVRIETAKNAKVTVYLEYKSKEDIKCYHNLILKVNASKNSVVNVVLINYMNVKSSNFISIENNILNSANVNYTVIDFGGKYSITNYNSNLEEENSNNKIDTIYLGKEDQILDLNYIANLYGKNSNVDIEVQGALKDFAKKHFKGTIDFKRGSKKSTGNENESCVLLSDSARSLSLPMLLCSEEDVEGNHSSSAGKIENKDLFYIMSRGFDEKEAAKLMIRAKFNYVIDKIKNEEVKSELLQKIDEILD